MLTFRGVKIPPFSRVIDFIEGWKIEDKYQACEHAWETYMNLAALVSKASDLSSVQQQVGFDVLFREATVAMGAMWAFRQSLPKE